jgi:hypothetical protein
MMWPPPGFAGARSHRSSSNPVEEAPPSSYACEYVRIRGSPSRIPTGRRPLLVSRPLPTLLGCDWLSWETSVDFCAYLADMGFRVRVVRSTAFGLRIPRWGGDVVFFPSYYWKVRGWVSTRPAQCKTGGTGGRPNTKSAFGGCMLLGLHWTSNFRFVWMSRSSCVLHHTVLTAPPGIGPEGTPGMTVSPDQARARRICVPAMQTLSPLCKRWERAQSMYFQEVL